MIRSSGTKTPLDLPARVVEWNLTHYRNQVFPGIPTLRSTRSTEEESAHPVRNHGGLDPADPDNV